ncbi:major facilitator superfamily domain-containing protein [Scenedesmus sp. NREL 46B-D3]|nr:major facilitator superfamily domain-containing protein [Scenedesmus sp. NREL 46B-D3]
MGAAAVLVHLIERFYRVCVFANSIGLLVAFRALQMPSFVPVTCTFIMVVVYAAVVILPMVCFMPETHQYRKLRRLRKLDPQAAGEVEERDTIFSTPPVFKAPHYPIAILCEREVFLHAIVALLLFGSMFCSITELPLFLAAPPYNLSPAMIGLCYIPAGVASMVVSPLGGLLSDRAAATHPQKPLVRLVFNNSIAGFLMPASLLLYGWVVHFRLHLAVVLVSQFAIGVALSAYLPAIFGYLTALKQSAAAAAAAGVHSGMFIMSGVLILVASAAVAGMGMGPFFTLLAGLNLLTTGTAAVQIFRHREQSREMIRSASRAQLAGGAAAAAAR